MFPTHIENYNLDLPFTMACLLQIEIIGLLYRVSMHPLYRLKLYSQWVIKCIMSCVKYYKAHMQMHSIISPMDVIIGFL